MLCWSINPIQTHIESHPPITNTKEYNILDLYDYPLLSYNYLITENMHSPLQNCLPLLCYVFSREFQQLRFLFSSTTGITFDAFFGYAWKSLYIAEGQNVRKMVFFFQISATCFSLKSTSELRNNVFSTLLAKGKPQSNTRWLQFY